jgi:hypothetical protein
MAEVADSRAVALEMSALLMKTFLRCHSMKPPLSMRVT